LWQKKQVKRMGSLMSLTLYLVRAAPVHPHHAGTLYGNDASIIDVTDGSDVAISQLQRETLTMQFGRLAARLPRTAPFLISAARRSRQTLEQLQAQMPQHSQLRILYPWFTEQQWGDWTDMPHTVLQARDMSYRFVRNNGPGWEALTPPSHRSGNYAESFNGFTNRVEMGFEQILVAHALQGQGKLTALTHGGVVRVANMLYGGASTIAAVNTIVPHLSITTLTHAGGANDRWKIVKFAEPV
jgi:broad specificity phosphatase PhoE